MLACFVYLCHHPRSHFTTLLTRPLCYGPFYCSYVFVPWLAFRQRRIFTFGAVSKFKSGNLLEGSRRLMSYKSALHVIAAFTEQVVPIHKHITLFWIASISGTKIVTMQLTKKAAVKLSDHTPITYLLSTSLASCNLKNGLRRFAPHIIRNNNQFSTPWKENAHGHSLQSFALILLPFVSGI